jgi:hypothetical protein
VAGIAARSNEAETFNQSKSVEKLPFPATLGRTPLASNGALKVNIFLKQLGFPADAI